MNRVLLTPQAEEDLLDVAFYIARDSVDAADRFIEKIERILALIAASPKMGRRREELGSNLQSFPVEAYVVFHRSAQGGIEVVRVLHGARDIPRLF